MNNKAVSVIKKSVLVLLFANIIFLVYGLSTIKYRNYDLESKLVRVIVTTIKEELSSYKYPQAEYYILRREPWEIKIGKLSIFEGEYRSAWHYYNGYIERVKESDWEVELSRDNQVLWIFHTNPILKSQEELCVDLTCILPSSRSVDGKQRRIGSTTWLINLNSDSGALERNTCSGIDRGFDFLFTH